MGNRRSPLGFLRAPLGHWVIAAILAVAVAWGTHAGLGYRAVQSAQTAVLSWDSAAARHMDPSLVDVAEPAVATAESLLSDRVVAGLASSANTARIGEFRFRLELRQSSANVLQVRFRDADPERAVKTANAVARSLAGAAVAPRAPVAPVSAPAPIAPPQVQKTPAASPANHGNDALADSLSQLESELSGTQKKLDTLSMDAWQRREHPELSSYRESKEQQLLTAQVGASLKEIANLRADPANASVAQEPLRQIQEALRSVWPASRADMALRGSADTMGFNAAGVDAGRLRQERTEYAHAIEVVRKAQGEVQRLAPAQAAQTPPPQPVAAPPAPAPAAASSPGTAGAITESEIPQAPVEEPFQVLRLAGTPVPNPLWPGALAGFLCGMLYLAVAGSRYRRDEEEEYAEEIPTDSQRLITPATPMRPVDFFSSAESRPADSPGRAEPRSPDFFSTAEPHPADSPGRAEPRSPDFFGSAESGPADSPGRAEPRSPDFFSTAEPHPADSPGRAEPRSPDFFGSAESGPADSPGRAEPRSPDFFSTADTRPADSPGRAEPRLPDFLGSAELRPPDIVLPQPQIEAPDLPASVHDERNGDLSVQEITMAEDETKRPFQEKVGGEEAGADPWVDNVMKGLSETSIGRMFEKPASTDRDEESEEVHGQRLSIHPDRLAG